MQMFDQLVTARRSVRRFHSDRPVPMALLREALQIAQHAPSNCNVQPWRVYVAAGDACINLREALLTAFDAGSTSQPDSPVDKFSGRYREHQIACAVTMYGHMNVARDDKPGRVAAERRNFEFFDAPHVMFVCMEKSFGVGVALDIGMYVQTLMLALTARGVATCAQAALRHQSPLIKQQLNIPDNLQLLCGISYGYEDASAAVNRTRQPREGIDANVVVID